MTARKTAKEKTAAAKAPPDGNGFSLISSDKLIEIYTAMVKCRMIAQHADALQLGKQGGDLYSAGREAALAGVLVDLLPGDALSLSRGDFAAGFIRGMPLKDVFRCLAATENGGGPARFWMERNNDAHGHVIPPAPSAAAQLNVACGVASAWMLKSEGRITVALCGEDAAPMDAWREALAFAGIHQLPVLFVCHRYVRSAAEEFAAQAVFDELAAHAQARRIPALTVDGNDAVAVYRVACESIGRARLGRGPTLIECRAYVCKNQKETRKAAPKPPEVLDPIRRMETYLLRKGLFNPALKRKIAATFRRELEAAAGISKSQTD
ncbi:MAG: hypothetical protein KGM96_13040 [Acidobacteriota bacterium]|nr:hypothetical protein [Acidobacteriota bacterium]